MGKERPVSVKFFIVTGVLMAIGIVVALFGSGLVAIILFLPGFSAILWGLIKRPKPEGELPCSSVSCCHYLKDNDEEQQ